VDLFAGLMWRPLATGPLVSVDLFST
jgi:hypothetical protein